MLRFFGILIITLIIAGCDGRVDEQTQHKKTGTNSRDIPDGKLGYPLGTYLVIEGIRAKEGKVGTRTLLVDTINRQKLTSSIAIWIDNVKDPGLPEGTRCIVRGYESGRMIGQPDLPETESSSRPQAGWQFFHYFLVTSIVQPETLRKTTGN